MIEETMTATDVLNRIINESLQDPSPVVHDDIKPLVGTNLSSGQYFAQLFWVMGNWVYSYHSSSY